MKPLKNSAINLFIFFIISAFVLGGGISGAFAKSDTFMVPANFSKLAEKARHSVVNIRTVKIIKNGGRVFRHFFESPFGDGKDRFQEFFERFFGDEFGELQRDYKQRSLGSGFIIDKAGYIVTNNHVIQGADNIKVKLYNGQEFDASVEGRDEKTDIALIKISGAKNLVPLKMGNSKQLEVGQWVVAIGSPFGLEQTVTAGIVSAKGRTIGSGPYDDFIQTDASINPGNSGGPLINMKSEIVGINTAIIAGGTGIGFAIPIDLAKGIINQLKKEGEVTRGWLGVAIQDLNQELAEYYGMKNTQGVLVTEVFKGDPAYKGGIKSEDIIISVDGKKVSSSRELSRNIAGINVGDRIKIKLLRDGRKKTVSVIITKRDDSKLSTSKQKEDEDELGIKVTSLRSEKAGRFGFKKWQQGVVVTYVKAGSKADEAGIKEGDLIKKINHTEIRSLENYRRQINKIDKGESFHIFIQRNGSFYVGKITK
ncbi:serine protease Do [Candidatus Magnetomoraceae bacterium gMMP-15]